MLDRRRPRSGARLVHRLGHLRRRRQHHRFRARDDAVHRRCRNSGRAHDRQREHVDGQHCVGAVHRAGTRDGGCADRQLRRDVHVFQRWHDVRRPAFRRLRVRSRLRSSTRSKTYTCTVNSTAQRERRRRTAVGPVELVHGAQRPERSDRGHRSLGLDDDGDSARSARDLRREREERLDNHVVRRDVHVDQPRRRNPEDRFTRRSQPDGPSLSPVSRRGRAYTCVVTATNGVGTGPASASSPPVVVGSPAAPTAVKTVTGSTATTTGTLTVTYTAAANNGSAITSFTATCTSTSPGAATPKTGTHTGATAGPITVTGLTNGKTYTCRVLAHNARGNGLASAPSPPVIVGSPAAPTNVHAAKVASGHLKVTFTLGANNGSAIVSTTTRAACRATAASPSRPTARPQRRRSR